MLGSGRAQKLGKQVSLFVVILIGILAASATPAWGVEPYFLQPSTAKASASLPPKVFGALNPQGSRVSTYYNGLEIPICEIFWVKTVAGQNARAGAEALYGKLQPGAFVGVIHFLNDQHYIRDFQYEMPAGYYTMRYAVMGDDGEALHAHPPDFVLLSPVRLDRDPSIVPSHRELMRRGQRATGGSLPAFMSLVQFEKSGNELPEVVTDDMGTCVLRVKLQLKSPSRAKLDELPFALVVATPVPDTGGS